MVYFSFNLQLESQWVEKIYSDNADELEERLLEIPLSLPYMADEEEFRPSNTTFEKNGQTYRAIKQRYVKDTLQLIYVTDSAKKNLDNTIKQWVSSLIQDELPDGSNNSVIAKVFAKDYTKPFNDIQLEPFTGEENKLIGFIFSTYKMQIINLNTPPPELVS